MGLNHTVRVCYSVMDLLERKGLVETVTEGLEELGAEGADHAKIVSIRNNKSVYVPFEANGLRGYAFSGRIKKENTT